MIGREGRAPGGGPTVLALEQGAVGQWAQVWLWERMPEATATWCQMAKCGHGLRHWKP